jgi:hypothetical protein
VERRVGLAVDHAVRLVGAVAAGVPAPAGQVEPARERHGIVDHHDLLVMRADGRVGVVVAQRDAPVGLPARPVEQRKLPVGAEHHREIPVEDVDAQAPAAAREEIQEIPEHRRRAARVVLPGEPGAAVEVPPDDDDRALGALRRLHECPEVVLAVDQRRDALRARDPAAVPSRLEQAAGCGVRAGRRRRLHGLVHARGVVERLPGRKAPGKLGFRITCSFTAAARQAPARHGPNRPSGGHEKEKARRRVPAGLAEELAAGG